MRIVANCSFVTRLRSSSGYFLLGYLFGFISQDWQKLEQQLVSVSEWIMPHKQKWTVNTIANGTPLSFVYDFVRACLYCLFLSPLPAPCSMTELYRKRMVDDRGMHDDYKRHYERALCPYKMAKNQSAKFTLLEIGRLDGESTLLWAEYFPAARIVSLDTKPWPKWRTELRSSLEDRVHIIQGSQFDGDLLESICEQYKDIDIVIDDGSHVNKHVLFTFEKLFRCVRLGGLYVIEDTQTSYWPKKYGGSCSPLAEATTLNFMKSLIDQQNYKEIPPDNTHYKVHPFAPSLAELKFVHNLVFITKDRNDYPIGSNSNTADTYRCHHRPSEFP